MYVTFVLVFYLQSFIILLEPLSSGEKIFGGVSPQKLRLASRPPVLRCAFQHCFGGYPAPPPSVSPAGSVRGKHYCLPRGRYFGARSEIERAY